MSEEEHFERLIKLPVAEREAYLLAVGDSELTARLRQLLSAHCDSESLLALGEMDTTAVSSESRSTATVGPYKLREQIGEGGMGTVMSPSKINRFAAKWL